MLDVLIHDGLRTLDVDTGKDHVSSRFFQQRGTVRSLETFVWPSSHVPDDHDLEFLRANLQLTKLSIPSIKSKVLFDTRLFPLLSKSFKTLKSLSINRWEGVSISNEALELISTLKTFEQLHVSAGEQISRHCNWLIDHNVMRSYLSKLPYLRKLAFTRDSYDNWIPSSAIEDYYQDQFVVSDNGFVDWEMPDEEHKRLWEEWHRRRIQYQAIKYFKVVPALKSIYLGQISFHITRPKDGDEGHAKNLIRPYPTRDRSYEFENRTLGAIFGKF